MRTVISFFLVLFFGSGLLGQCCEEGQWEIVDFVVTEIVISVSGAVNDDLADASQGVCAVYLEFSHEWVGDMEIELVSPGGQSVILLGPGNGANSGFTDFTTWDISLLPCSDPVSPDGMFSAAWNGAQPWGIFGNFSGSYYPFLFCLEDFDVGTVNGDWVFRVTDGSQFYDGLVSRVGIDFCMEEGVECLGCEGCPAEAGSLIDSVYSYCMSDSGASPSFTYSEEPQFPQFGFSTISYLIQDGIVLDTFMEGNLSIPGVPGEYAICELVYSIDSVEWLPLIGDSWDLDSLASLLEELDSIVCGDLGEVCPRLIVSEVPDTVRQEIPICNGEGIVLRDSFIDLPGTYHFVSQSGVCDSVFEYEVEEVLPGVTIAVDTIDLCAPVFFAEALIDGSYDSLFWTLDGVFQGELDSVFFTSSGILCVEVYSQGCQANICEDIDFEDIPEVEILGDSLFCLGDSVLLRAAGDFQSFEWSGGVFSDSIWITQEGEVFLVGLTTEGCRDTARTELQFYPERIPIIAGQDSICEGGQTMLVVNGDEFERFEWFPGQEMTLDILVSDGGWYGVEALDSNGCLSSDSIFVTEVSAPRLALLPSLSVCNADSFGSTLFMDLAFVSGDTFGVWADVSNSGASGMSPTWNFDGVAEGSYDFQFTTDVAIAPCEDLMGLVTVNVFDCSCPRLRILQDTVIYCILEELSVDLSELYISDSLGSWSVLESTLMGGISVQGDSVFTSQVENGEVHLEFFSPLVEGDCDQRDTLVILLRAIDTLPFEERDYDFCLGQDTTLFLNDLLSTDLAWSYLGDPSDVAGAFGVPDTLRVSMLDVGEYVFEAIVDNDPDCPSDTAIVRIEVFASPELVVSQDTFVGCEQAQLVLYASTELSPLEWTTTDGTLLSILSDSSALVQGSGTYRVTAGGGTECEISDSILVALDSFSPQIYISSSDAVCPGEADGFIVIDSIGGVVGGVDLFLNGNPLFGNQVTGLVSGVYDITVASFGGCTYLETVILEEGSAVDGEIVGECLVAKDEISEYEFLPENASVLDSFSWYVDEDFRQNGGFFSTAINRDLMISVVARSTDGCLGIFEKQVEAWSIDDVYIPNVFSPNGDGVNDLWRVESFAENSASAEIRVFDRWGSLVYSEYTPNLQELRGWDGRAKNDLCAPGVYVYELALRSGSVYEVLHGDVTLIR